jgi:tetratricopeptide (TPR) repeat protein
MSDDTGAAPDPGQVRDVAEFVETLRQLRLWAGGPPFRVLAKQVGPMLRPPRELTHSTLSDLFRADRRRLDMDMVTATVRALGVAEADVTKWRAACVRVQGGTGFDAGGSGGAAGAAASVAIRRLPPDLATFTGRGAEVEALLRTVDRSGGPATVVVSAIEGMGGVGKTRLAVHVAHTLVRSGRFADVQLSVNLRGFDPDHEPADPGDVLESLLRQLGVPTADIPSDLAERAGLFRDRMHGRDAVLILDNAADARQVRHLIPASPTCLVLITSRRTLTELEDAAWHQLGVFSRDEALALLARIAGAERVGAEPEAALRIVERCGMLPLAVSVAASRLRSRPAWRLADLAERLEREDATTSEIGGATFDVSYRDLPDRAKGLFRLLGIHPGLDFTAASVAAPAGLTPDEAERTLELLLDENLVQQSVAGRYEIHDLLRAYAAERAEAEMTEAERRAVVRTALRWHVAVVTLTALAVSPDRVLPAIHPAVAAVAGPQASSAAEAVLWYGRERANLMQAVAVAGRQDFDSLAWRLPISMAYFEELAQNYRVLERLMSTALPHARVDTDPDAETDVVRWLTFALTAQKRPAEAIGPLDRVLEARRAAGDELRTGRILGSLADAHTSIGDPGRGLELASEAIETLEKIGGPVPSSFLTIASVCLMKLGRRPEALEYQQAFVERSRKVGDPRAVALGQHNVGDNLLLQGRMEEAAEAFEEGVAVAAQVADRYVRADCLNGLALTLKARGLIEEARARHREAVAVFDDLPGEEAARYLAQLEASSLRYVE